MRKQISFWHLIHICQDVFQEEQFDHQIFWQVSLHIEFWHISLQGLTHLFLGQVHLQALLNVILHLLNVAGGDLLPVCRSRRFRHRPLCMADPCSKKSYIILNQIEESAKIPPETSFRKVYDDDLAGSSTTPSSYTRPFCVCALLQIILTSKNSLPNFTL